MTKAKAAPKIGSRRNWKASPKVTPWGQGSIKIRTTSTASSPQVTTTAAAAADLDPLREPQQPAQEAVPVPAVPSTAHEDAISATQDHTSFLDGMQSHESNRCP